MKFSIVHLLLLLASWPIAYALSPHLTLVTVREYYCFVATEKVVDGVRYVAEQLDDQNMLTHSTLVNSPHLAQPWSQIDSWGNPLQYGRGESDGMISANGIALVYSLGFDGKSESHGNDPDDINSWDKHHRLFYGQQLRNRHTQILLWRTVWATPVIFLVLLAGKRLLSGVVSLIA